MGSYAGLSIAGHELFATKGYVDPVAMSVFTELDRQAVILPKEGDPTGQTEAIPRTWTDADLVDLPDDGTVYVRT